MNSRHRSVTDLLAERARIDAELVAVLGERTEAINVRFAVVVKRLREAKGLSQQELADLIGLGRTTVTNIEGGRQTTTWANAVLLAVALDASLDEFR